MYAASYLPELRRIGSALSEPKNPMHAGYWLVSHCPESEPRGFTRAPDTRMSLIELTGWDMRPGNDGLLQRRHILSRL